MRVPKGFTLIELLLTLIIIAITVGIGLPALDYLGRQAKITAVTSAYLHAFNSTRASALSANRNISMCPLDSKGKCSGLWGSTVVLFYDPDKDGKLANSGDIVEKITLPADRNIRVTFNAFGSTKYVTLRGNGTYRRNGTFRICPLKKGEHGRAIVINVLGRARTEKIIC